MTVCITNVTKAEEQTPGLIIGDVMPYVTADDGVKLYYEETGQGLPIVFVHEFAGDFRSYEPQVRYFGRRYRCVAYNARGYPPSDAPNDEQSYSQDRARDDVRAVLDGLSIEQAHIVGISMGGFATLHFLMKRTIPSAALVMLPRSGHTINLEEPALFNRFLEQFFHQVESGRWQVRDPRSITDRIL